MVNKWWVGWHGVAHSPGGCYSITVLNQALSSWTLFWLGLGYSFLLAAQWWSLIKHGTVLWNLQGMFEGRKEQKKEKRLWGRLAKWEILVETEAGEALQNKKCMSSCCSTLYLSVCAREKLNSSSVDSFRWNETEDLGLSMSRLTVLLQVFHWHLMLSVSTVNKHKPWIETSYHGVITENTDVVLLDPPLVALDKDAPIPYAGMVHFNLMAVNWRMIIATGVKAGSLRPNGGSQRWLRC